MSTTPTQAARDVAVPFRRRGLFSLLLQNLIEWQERASSRQSLVELDDRLLRDIGLTRSMVDAETNKSFWQS